MTPEEMFYCSVYLDRFRACRLEGMTSAEADRLADATAKAAQEIGAYRKHKGEVRTLAYHDIR